VRNYFRFQQNIARYPLTRLFLETNLSVRNLCIVCLVTGGFSLSSVITRLVVTQSAALNDRTWSTLERRRLSIKIWSIWLWLFRPGDVQVNLLILRRGNIVLSIVRFLDVAKFTSLTPLTLISRNLSFPTVRKCLPYPLWQWNLLAMFSHGISGIYRICVLVPRRSWTFRTMISYHPPLSITYILSLTNAPS
jgi:hypothetical protein